MTKLINFKRINKHIKTANFIYGPDAGIFNPDQRTARKAKLICDLKSVADLELITRSQYRKLLKKIQL